MMRMMMIMMMMMMMMVMMMMMTVMTMILMFRMNSQPPCFFSALSNCLMFMISLNVKDRRRDRPSYRNERTHLKIS